MKFGKSLSNQIEETLPEWRDKFLSYKELKKRLKLIEPKDADVRASKRPRLAKAAGFGECSEGREKVEMTEEETEFIRLLEDELEKFNSFFVEKEEEYIITLKPVFRTIERSISENA
ncbi:unnamed protein product [Ilex paraguariensis]|uniref:SPX domain-containing protein n=1 Tax=Ilex paraguariensis TaxID=185542 RepID=A0ABC8U640_9AQUA